MTARREPELRVLPDPEVLADSVAQAFVGLARSAANDGGRFAVALAGGRTPRAVYRRLATTHRAAVPWEGVHLFWGDERYVPPDHPESNYRMARDALLDHVSIPAGNVHPFRTELAEPEEAARAYEQTLRQFFGDRWPRFDLVLLGLGTDGHVASLFPGSPALNERDRLAVHVQGPKPPRLRLTLTLPAINRAAHVHFLVVGASKAEALQRTLEGARDPLASPAQAVRPTDGEVCWWLDREATNRLKTTVERAGRP